jgi:peptidoglycan/LPS O-acetylase OafA/YrhL
MAGALLAVLVRSEVFVPAKHVKIAWVSLLTAAALAILAENHEARWIAFSMTSLASMSLIFLSLFSQRKWVNCIFRNRFLTYTGVISYGLYLLHKIPTDVTKEILANRHPLISMSIIFVSSYLLAAVSWAVLEKPFLKLKRFFDFMPVARSS